MEYDARLIAKALTEEQRRLISMTRQQPDLFDGQPAIVIEPHDRINSSTITALTKRKLAHKYRDGVLRMTALGMQVAEEVARG